jgi:hypothetical protein
MQSAQAFSAMLGGELCLDGGQALAQVGDLLEMTDFAMDGGEFRPHFIAEGGDT